MYRNRKKWPLALGPTILQHHRCDRPEPSPTIKPRANAHSCYALISPLNLFKNPLQLLSLLAIHHPHMRNSPREMTIKIPNLLIVNCIRMFQCQLIPIQGVFSRVLKARNIMRGDAGIIIVLTRFPGLFIKNARFFSTMLEFSARALHTELDDRVV